MDDSEEWLDGKMDEIKSVNDKRMSAIRVFVATVRETPADEQRRVFVAMTRKYKAKNKL